MNTVKGGVNKARREEQRSMRNTTQERGHSTYPSNSQYPDT